MTNNPRRANLTALNRTNTRTSFDDVSVINATALPRSVSYNVGSDRPMDSNFSKASRQAVSPSEDSRLKDSLSHDPFVSISRAINNVKLRAGSQLRTISANKYSRSSRYQPCYNVVQKLSRVITLAMMILIFIFLSFRKGAGTFSESNISFWDSMRKKPLNGRIESASAREALKHRASFSLNKFEAGPWVIGLIADLDKESCHIRERHDETSRASTCGSANMWLSYLKRGVLDVSYQVSPKSTFGRIDDVGLK